MARTQEEIVDRIRAIQDAKSDMFGWTIALLLEHLDYEHAKPWLLVSATRTEWETANSSTHDEALLKEAVDYLDFAWGKASDHRGISAGRSIDKMREFLWMLAVPDEQLAEFNAAEYAPYGAPQLAVAARILHREVPDDRMVRRMAEGKACREEGCGECGL